MESLNTFTTTTTTTTTSSSSIFPTTVFEKLLSEVSASASFNQTQLNYLDNDDQEDDASLLPNSSLDYVYDYDYDLSVNTLPLNELVVNAIGYGLVLIMGLVGNILVVVSVARYRRMHNVTNIFLLSLATADLLLVCICVPVKGESLFESVNETSVACERRQPEFWWSLFACLTVCLSSWQSW